MPKLIMQEVKYTGSSYTDSDEFALKLIG